MEFFPSNEEMKNAPIGSHVMASDGGEFWPATIVENGSTPATCVIKWDINGRTATVKRADLKTANFPKRRSTVTRTFVPNSTSDTPRDMGNEAPIKRRKSRSMQPKKSARVEITISSDEESSDNKSVASHVSSEHKNGGSAAPSSSKESGSDDDDEVVRTVQVTPPVAQSKSSAKRIVPTAKAPLVPSAKSTRTSRSSKDEYMDPKLAGLKTKNGPSSSSKPIFNPLFAPLINFGTTPEPTVLPQPKKGSRMGESCKKSMSRK